MKKGIILSLLCLNTCCASYGHAEDFFHADPVTFLKGGVIQTNKGFCFPANKFLVYDKEFDLIKQSNIHSKKLFEQKMYEQVMFEHLAIFEKYGSAEDVKILKASQAEILLQNMINERAAYDVSMQEAENTLILANLYDGTMEALFKAAMASVSSVPGGGMRNYLLPAVWETIKFSVEKGFQTYNMWNKYNYYLQDAKNHAEIFDYYMQMLLKIQGNS